MLVQKRQVHAHAGQRLAQFVVYLARDADPFFFAHGFHVGGQGAKLFALAPQFRVQALAFGNVAREAGGAEHLAQLVEHGSLEGLEPTGGALGEDGLFHVLLLAGGHHTAVVVDIALGQLLRPYIEISQPHHIT